MSQYEERSFFGKPSISVCLLIVATVSAVMLGMVVSSMEGMQVTYFTAPFIESLVAIVKGLIVICVSSGALCIANFIYGLYFLLRN